MHFGQDVLVRLNEELTITLRKCTVSRRSRTTPYPHGNYAKLNFSQRDNLEERQAFEVHKNTLAPAAAASSLRNSRFLPHKATPHPYPSRHLLDHGRGQLRRYSRASRRRCRWNPSRRRSRGCLASLSAATAASPKKRLSARRERQKHQHQRNAWIRGGCYNMTPHRRRWTGHKTGFIVGVCALVFV